MPQQNVKRLLLDPVSIRARRCRRAMLPRRLRRENDDRFQSAPVVADGRCVCTHTLTGRVPRFNPRPSLPTGDACAERRSHHLAIVSIRARRCRRAMQVFAAECVALDSFQSAPVVADGRCQSGPGVRPARACFNPRPSLPTGDARWCAPILFMPRGFQSAPVVADGRCVRTPETPSLEQAFQSAPVVADGRCLN